jgi:hypothetical protein
VSAASAPPEPSELWSSGGSASLTGTGTIGSSSHTVTGVDVSALPGGTLTLSVTISNASGTGAAKTASFTPSFTGILDSLPTAAAAYSVRRLRAAYTGPLLRLRRSTDNVQQDIGFTIAGDLDQAKLFAQLLGPFGTRRTEDFPAGYEGLQSGWAKASNVPTLRAYERDTEGLVVGGALLKLLVQTHAAVFVWSTGTSVVTSALAGRPLAQGRSTG